MDVEPHGALEWLFVRSITEDRSASSLGPTGSFRQIPSRGVPYPLCEATKCKRLWSYNILTGTYMKRWALFIMYSILAGFARGYQNKPNQVSGPSCTTSNGLMGNCVTPDEEGHDYDCNNVDGFFVTEQGICPDSKVQSLPLHPF